MIAAVVGALVLAAQPAGSTESAASTPVPAEPAKAPKPKDDSQKVICKYETTLGSLIPKKLCGTKAEWDALTEDGKKITEEVQTRALVKPTADMAKSH